MIRSCIMLMLMTALFAPMTGRAAERYADPISRISVDLPTGEWTRRPVLGDDIALLIAPDGATIRLVGREERSRRKAAPHQPGTASFIQPVEDGAVEVLCTPPPRRFLEVFFVCRTLAQSIRRERGPMDSAARADALRALIQEGKRALLDGRGGCPGVARRVRRGAAEARKQKNTAVARQLESLVGKLEGGTQAGIELDEERRRDPFFSRLVAARLLLDQGEGQRAKELLAGSDGTSRLAGALRMWVARLAGDLSAVRSRAEEFNGTFCGESGALAALELGLAIQDEDPERAQALFEAAIAADRSLVRAYVSLCRLLLDRGEQAEDVSVRLRALLTRAPAASDIERFRRDLEMVENARAMSP